MLNLHNVTRCSFDPVGVALAGDPSPKSPFVYRGIYARIVAVNVHDNEFGAGVARASGCPIAVRVR